MELGGRMHPVIIGIVGDSAAGKTTFAAGLAKVLGTNHAVHICIDDYHKFSRQQRAENGLTPHDPACNYMDILEQHVALLRDGQPILKPVYNHNGGVLEAPEYVEPKDFIILEGLLGYATPKLRDAYDVKFYLEPQEQLRLRWKFKRDTTGGYPVETVMASLERLKRDSVLHVIPQRAFADMVVSFYPPDERPDESSDRLNVRHILRPTLPYLDLTPLLEKGESCGFGLELARDIDGRPVDSLNITGDISPAQAEEMEHYLWGLTPSKGEKRPPIGQYQDETNATRHSPPLALSQLVVTHYLLNAALGEDVVQGV